MEEIPTTDRQAATSHDQPPALPEEKSGVKLPLKVSQLRWKLGRKAKREPKFRFYALYDRIYRFDVLTAAWWLVLKKNGAPGVDHMSCKDIIDGPGAAQYQWTRPCLRRVQNRSTIRHQSRPSLSFLKNSPATGSAGLMRNLLWRRLKQACACAGM